MTQCLPSKNFALWKNDLLWVCYYLVSCSAASLFACVCSYVYGSIHCLRYILAHTYLCTVYMQYARVSFYLSYCYHKNLFNHINDVFCFVFFVLRETLSQQHVERKPKDYKRDGRICQLRTQDDGEEDNNTWNGNSTQQM